MGKHRNTPEAAIHRARSTRAAQVLKLLKPQMGAVIRLTYANDMATAAARRDRRKYA
jgi:hypothetical protein